MLDTFTIVKNIEDENSGKKDKENESTKDANEGALGKEEITSSPTWAKNLYEEHNAYVFWEKIQSLARNAYNNWLDEVYCGDDDSDSDYESDSDVEELEKQHEATLVKLRFLPDNDPYVTLAALINILKTLEADDPFKKTYNKFFPTLINRDSDTISSMDPIKAIETLLANEAERITLQLEKKISKGATADVFKGKRMVNGDKESSHTVVIKQLKDKINPEVFHNEIEIFKKINNESSFVIKWIEDYTLNKKHCIVLEWANLGSLNAVIRNNDISIDLYLEKIIKDILSAVEFIHDKNIIHTDIKSDNFLLKGEDEINDQGEVVNTVTVSLADFGTAIDLEKNKNLLQTKGNKDEIDADVAVVLPKRVGTLAWSAPEVLTKLSYSKKSDIYSTASTLFELLAREWPHEDFEIFEDEDINVFINNVNKEDLRPDITLVDANINKEQEGYKKELKKTVKSLMINGWLADPKLRKSASTMKQEINALTPATKSMKKP